MLNIIVCWEDFDFISVSLLLQLKGIFRSHCDAVSAAWLDPEFLVIFTCTWGLVSVQQEK